MTPTTTRRPALRWVDPRFLIGGGLVVASVLGMLAVLGVGDRPGTAYAAPAPLSPGQALDPAALRLVEADLDEHAAAYLTPESLPAGPVVVTRPVGEGEFIPLSALGSADTSRSHVLVPVSAGLPQGADAGAAVELWSSPEVSAGAFAAPVVLVGDARVLRIIEDTSAFAAAGDTQVELQVPRGQLAAVLSAVANGAKLSVVPVYAPAAS